MYEATEKSFFLALKTLFLPELIWTKIILVDFSQLIDLAKKWSVS